MKFLSVILCVLGGSMSAAEPLFETQRLFELTPKNKPNYRIPSIIQAPNGAILVICEKRNDGPGDIGNHDIVMRRSADKGKTWSNEIVILDDEDRVCTELWSHLTAISEDGGVMWGKLHRLEELLGRAALRAVQPGLAPSTDGNLS